jgi:RNA polymerase sigma factor (sigma-70 family)
MDCCLIMLEIPELGSTRWTLIGRLKNLEDQEGWEDFFNTYWKLIFTVALKAGLTHIEAQEVVQETLISVSKTIQEFTANGKAGSFKSWLLKLTSWRIVDQVRKRNADTLPANPPSPTETPLEERIPDPAGIELEKIWAEEWEQNLVDNALKKLERQVSAKHYQIFYLHSIQNLPPEKVARALGIKVEQVYLIKHRLRKIFDDALKELENKPAGKLQGR